MTREQRRQAWIARITDYKSSGFTMLAWCTANHFKLDQLKYWLRKTKEASPSVSATPSTRWMPLTVVSQPDTIVSTSSLVVRIGQASVELRAGFDPQLLREIVLALE